MPLDSATFTINTFEAVSPGGETLAASNVVAIDGTRYELEFTRDFAATDNGDWVFRSTPDGPQDLAGNRLLPNSTATGGLLTVAIPVPPPTSITNPSGYPYDQLISVTLTPADGYAFPATADMSGRLYSEDPDATTDPLGSTVSTAPDTIAINIGSAGDWRIELTGTYATSETWFLTIPLTTIDPPVPLSEQVSVFYVENTDPALSLHPFYTLALNDQDLVFDVRYISPLDPPGTTFLVNTIDESSVKLIGPSGGERSPTEIISTTIDGNSVIARYRFLRDFTPGTWAVTVIAETVADGEYTIPYNKVLYTLEADYFVQGAETWNPSNPFNPSLPRLEPDSNSDLMGRIINAGQSGWPISNIFNLGANGRFTVNSGGDGIELIEVTADGGLCFTFSEELTGHSWNYRIDTTSQLISTDTEVTVNLGDHLDDIAFLVSSNGGPDPILDINSTGLTSGSVAIVYPGATDSPIVSVQAQPRGVLKFTARNFELIEIAGTSTTVGATDRKLCINYVSDLKYYDIQVVERSALGVPIINGSTQIIPIASNFYDTGFIVYAGEITNYDIKINGVSAPQDFTFYNDGTTSLTFVTQQSITGGTFRYCRYQQVGSQITNSFPVQVTINLSDGQVFEHSYTVEVDEINPPGIYGATNGQEFNFGDTVTFTLGNPDPAKTISRVVVAYDGGGASYDTESSANAAVASSYSFIADNYGDYTITVEYHYTDGTTEIIDVVISVPAPPPVEPEQGFLMLQPLEVSLGAKQDIYWNTSPNSPFREMAELSLYLLPGPSVVSLPIANTGGTHSYIVREIGAINRVDFILQYADWPDPVVTQVDFTPVAPPAPQNVVAFATGGVLRIQWQESQVTTANAIADSYTVKTNDIFTGVSGQQVTQHPGNISYRYTDLPIPSETVTIEISSVWGSTNSPNSEPIAWVAFAERTFGEIGNENAPADIAAVANAIGAYPTAEEESFAAGDAELARTLNHFQAAAAFYNALSARTAQYWETARTSTANTNLQAVAQANVNWLVGVPGYLDAARECTVSGGGACTFADAAAADYALYLEYAKTKDSDSLISITAWFAAGKPTS